MKHAGFPDRRHLVTVDSVKYHTVHTLRVV